MTPRKATDARWLDTAFRWVCLLSTVLPVVLLVFLLGGVFADGFGRLDLDFLTSYPSRRAASAGVLPAVVGTFALMGLTALLALPIGVAAAVHLEEFADQGRLMRLIEVNIANLAGVPSVLYGLLGLEVFVRTIGLGRSLIAGAATLALLILPVVILSSREALRTVPRPLREAGLALGATPWQTVRQVVLPQAMPGILTGAILALSRAIGEAAPLLVVGALAYVAFLPDGLDAPFTALPIQIFNWVSRPQTEFHTNAAAGIVVLLVTLLLFNAIAVGMRNHYERRQEAGW